MSDIETTDNVKSAVDFESLCVEILWEYGFHVLSSIDTLNCIRTLCAQVNAMEIHHSGGINESQ